MDGHCASHQRLQMLQRIMDSINAAAEKCAGLFLIGMVLAISISVFVRLLYTYTGIPFSTPWAEELGRFMMVGSVFIGGAVATYRLRLIGVDAFIGMVPESVARWLRVVAHILTLMLALLLAWKSIRLIELGMRQTSPAMEMPMAYIYIFMFIGCVLMSLNTFTHVIKELLSVEVSQQGGEAERVAAAMQNSEGGAL